VTPTGSPCLRFDCVNDERLGQGECPTLCHRRDVQKRRDTPTGWGRGWRLVAESGVLWRYLEQRTPTCQAGKP